MHFGIEVIPFGELADPRNVARLAQAADEAGWEALWIWDHVLMPWGTGDPWVSLAAAASVTSRLKLVPGVAALPRYHPHLLARTLAGLDLLSQGRVILGAGAGAIDAEFASFGGPGTLRERAEMLDESLALLAAYASGEPVSYTGKHYRADGAAILPRPVQQPRIPVWIGGDSPAALRRAARWDGWIIGVIDEKSQVTLPPEMLAEKVSVIRQERASDAPFEVAVDGVSEPGQPNRVREFADAGATWWFESVFGMRGSLDDLLARVKAGPPG